MSVSNFFFLILTLAIITMLQSRIRDLKNQVKRLEKRIEELDPNAPEAVKYPDGAQL